MKAQQIELKGKLIEVTSRYFIAKGNNGNHTGYNRTWEFVAKCNTKKDAVKLCKEHGEHLEVLQPCTYFKYDELENAYNTCIIIGGVSSIIEI